jgi:hypothetical protein
MENRTKITAVADKLEVRDAKISVTILKARTLVTIIQVKCAEYAFIFAMTISTPSLHPQT